MSFKHQILIFKQESLKHLLLFCTLRIVCKFLQLENISAFMLKVCDLLKLTISCVSSSTLFNMVDIKIQGVHMFAFNCKMTP
jgi:hypothetical protein